MKLCCFAWLFPIYRSFIPALRLHAYTAALLKVHRTGPSKTSKTLSQKPNLSLISAVYLLLNNFRNHEDILAWSDIAADGRFANDVDFICERCEYSQLFLLLWCLSVPEALKAGPISSEVRPTKHQ